MKTLLLIFSIFLINSCNVASVITGTSETELGSNFTKKQDNKLDLTSGIRYFWRFEESGTGIARSSSFGSATTTDNTTSGVSTIVGQRGNGISCEALISGSGFLQVSGDMSFSASANYNISFWVYMAANPIGGCSDENIVIESNNDFRVAMDDNCTTSTFDVDVLSGGAEMNLQPASNYNFPGWFHISVNIFNGGDFVDLYVNGNLEATNTLGSPTAVGAATFSICSRDTDGGFFLDGRLDSLGVWDRNLTPEEIEALYNGNNNVD